MVPDRVPQTWTTLLMPALLVYLLLVRSLRYRRARNLEASYAPCGRSSFRQMSTNDAQAILKDLTELEFPRFFGFSIIFALFKTYGIPSVSALLVATGQLADIETASKRVADTGVLLLEFALNKPDSERTIQAIARMNYLHAPYQRSGKITNDDLLYTLSLFALEPGRWAARYEWRSLTDLELCACGVYWKSMGDAMGISYKRLASTEQGWAHGLAFLEELKEWSLQYEKQYMVPAPTNKRLADSHFDIICINVPRQLLKPCKKVMALLLGERLRIAMVFPQPGPVYSVFINGLLQLRKFVLRYLALPRPEILRRSFIPSAPDIHTGRYNSKEYLSFPWYVKPTWKARWGPKALRTRLLGRKVPGDDGNRYAPEGYTFSEIGPRALKGKGLKKMNTTTEHLLQRRRGECPFLIP